MDKEFMYIITNDKTLIKVKADKLSNILEMYLSPLSIEKAIICKTKKDLLETIKKELEKEN